MAPRRQPETGGRQDVSRAVLCTLVAAVLAGLSGGTWAEVGGHDLHAYFLARYEYAADALRAGRFPLWSPEQFCGEPFFASPQSGALYAPVLLAFSFLPGLAAFQALWAFHVFIYFLATLAYLGDHGISAPARVVGAFVGMAGILLGPGSGGGLAQPQFFAGAAWFPVLLLCWDRAQRRGAAPWLGLLSLAVAGQWYSGYPDFAMDTAVVLGVVATLDGGSTLTRRAGLLLLGLSIGTALAGAQLLALAEAVRESTRVEEVGVYASFRARAFAVDSFPRLAQRLLTHHGAAALILASVAMVRPSRVRIAWFVALLWTVLALNPPFSLLYRFPPFSESRFPVGWGHIGPILLGFLVAAGLHDGWQHRRTFVRAAALAIGLVAVAHAGRTVWAAPTIRSNLPPDYDLIAQRVPEIERVREAVGLGARVLSEPERVAGAHLRYALPSPGGYDPLAPRRVQHLLSELGIRLGKVTTWSDVAAGRDLASLLGLGIVVAPPAHVQVLAAAGFEVRVRLPAGDVVMYRPPVPRARLVHRVVVVGSEEESLAWMVGNASRTVTETVLEEATPVEPAEPPDGAPEGASVTAYAPDLVALRAKLASPGVLVLTDTWYPGWTVQVDGKPAPLLRADHAFRAVALAAGDHDVEFRYSPTWLVPGMLCSVAAAACTLTFLLLPLRIR